MDRPGGPSAAADDDLTPRRTSPPRFRGISFIVAESDPGLDPSETTSEEDHDGTSTPLGAVPAIMRGPPTPPSTARPGSRDGGTSHFDLLKRGLPLL